MESPRPPVRLGKLAGGLSANMQGLAQDLIDLGSSFLPGYGLDGSRGGRREEIKVLGGKDSFKLRGKSLWIRERVCDEGILKIGAGVRSIVYDGNAAG